MWCTLRKINTGIFAGVLFLFIISLRTEALGAVGRSVSPTSKPSSVPLRAPRDMFASCSRCHTIGKGKLIGPDLVDVQERHSEEWLVQFIQASSKMIAGGHKDAIALFQANNELPMPDHNFSIEETKSLIRYITLESKKLKANPRFLENDFNLAKRSNHWLLILAVFLLLLALVDIWFTKFIKLRVIHVSGILLALVVIGEISREEAVILGQSLGYEPEQPIKFSHRIHAGENKIDCIYCHTSVYESKYASIPPTTLCLNCHNLIRIGTNTGETEIDKIHEAVDSGKSISWVKVYRLPDHVFFSHAQHVGVGNIKCEKCHGDLTKMGRVQQVVDLSMGWCLNCHRETKVDFSNRYYAPYKQNEELKSGKISQVTVDDIGGNNCQKCHY